MHHLLSGFKSWWKIFRPRLSISCALLPQIQRGVLILCASVRACVCVCVCMQHVCMQVCVNVCVHACMRVCVYVCLICLSVCECVYVGAYCIICVCVGVTVRHYTLFITHYSFKQNQTQQLQKKYNMQAPFPIHIPIFFSLPFPILYLVLHCKFGIYMKYVPN